MKEAPLFGAESRRHYFSLHMERQPKSAACFCVFEDDFYLSARQPSICLSVCLCLCLCLCLSELNVTAPHILTFLEPFL